MQRYINKAGTNESSDTGGAGFLGRRLAVKLLERGSLKGADARIRASIKL